MSASKNSQRNFIVPLDAVSKGLAGVLADFRLPNLVKRTIPRRMLDGMYRTRKEMRRVLFSRGLPVDRVFEQPPEHRAASGSMSIIVPIHDAPLVTKRCLASLERYAAEAEVILVDDASKLPDTIGIIRGFSNRNGWKVIANAKALGHSSATAAGARLATRPYLCLLNSDTVITPWC